MDLTEVKKPNDCDEDCECKDCEMRTANDEKNVFVSVSPRRFELPKSTDKKAKMKIENNNAHPIYFRASTSNMDVFRPLPDNGHIPPNSKTCLDVQFYDSAVPLRRHEEVIVFTSVKPFELPPMYKERVCPFCLEPFDISKNHVPKTHSHTDECLPKSDHQIFMKNGKLSTNKLYAENNGSHDDFEIKYKAPKQKFKREYESRSGKSIETKKIQEEYKQNGKQSRNAAKYYAENSGSHHEDFEIQDKASKQKFKTEYEPKPREKETKKMQEKYREKITQKTNDYIQKDPKKSHFEEKDYKKRDDKVAKTEKTTGSRSLEEVCIHAQVHRPSASGCECSSCVQLRAEKEDRKRPGEFLTSEKRNDDRRIKSVEYISEGRLCDIEKGTQAHHETKHAKDERKVKGKEAHIYARVLGDKESFSETDISELSSRDVLPRRTEIISEEDYMKKKEKRKKKLQKRSEEVSGSKTEKDSKDQQKGSDEKSAEMEREPTLKVLDEKCNTLINLSRGNLFLLLLLMLTVVGGFTYCCSSRQPEENYLPPCIYNIWQYFG